MPELKQVRHLAAPEPVIVWRGMKIRLILVFADAKKYESRHVLIIRYGSEK
jgi:hypothetical protein